MSELAKMIGNKIRVLRTAKGLSQENIADALGLSQSGYARMERGEIDINLSRITEIAKILEVPDKELLNPDSVNFFFMNNSGGNVVGNKDGVLNFYQNNEIETLKTAFANMQTLIEHLIGRIDVLEKEKN